MKSCFFVGHREVDERILPELEAYVEHLICGKGILYFYVGRYDGFDGLATIVVKKLEEKYPAISLVLLLPYHPEEQHVELPPGFDGPYYPEGMEGIPRRYAIVGANKRMVDSCNWLVCYVRHGASNSRNLLEYAK